MRGRSQGDPSQPREVRHDYWGAILEAPDAVTLGRFYAELLGWEVLTEEPSIATEVEDLEAAVTHAIELGARLATHQPQEDVRVMLDPVGHPFCLYRG